MATVIGVVWLWGEHIGVGLLSAEHGLEQRTPYLREEVQLFTIGGTIS